MAILSRLLEVSRCGQVYLTGAMCLTIELAPWCGQGNGPGAIHDV